MIPVKRAKKVAVQYLRDISDPDQLHDVRLEEVELSEDETIWLITIGYTVKVELSLGEPPDNYMFPELAEAGQSHERIYKLFNIDAEKGVVKSMKMRVV